MPHFNPDESFSALRSHFNDGRLSSSIESLKVADLSAGDVVVRSHYAGVNYKDCLAITGRAKIIESFPRVAGIEVVGEVVESSVDRLPVGEIILVHGFRTGIAFDGGFSEVMRVPAAHVMPLSGPLTGYETAVIGLPGFTAGMALDRFERSGITPRSGPIAVSGATGAVGMMAISILARAGYQAVALTRKSEEVETLYGLGASEVINVSEIPSPGKPLEKERFAAVIDNVGGPILSWLLRSTMQGGCIASVGNAAGNGFDGSVLPFILRGVQLFGVVANADWDTRRRVWGNLAGAWKPDLEALAPYVKLIGLDRLMQHAEQQLAGKTRGRTIVHYKVD
jgi:acrylyl-CoA reductase (NADPH)